VTILHKKRATSRRKEESSLKYFPPAFPENKKNKEMTTNCFLNFSFSIPENMMNMMNMKESRNGITLVQNKFSRKLKSPQGL